jgi:hypothetical protein
VFLFLAVFGDLLAAGGYPPRRHHFRLAPSSPPLASSFLFLSFQFPVQI